MKKLLFSLIFAGVSAVTFNAQVWDMADLTKFPDASVVVPTTVDVLKFNGVSGSSAFAFTSNSVTIGDFSGTRRFQFGGNSYSGSTSPAVGTTLMPSKKWLEVTVAANSVLKIWGRGGGARNIIISDNTGLVLSSTAFAGNTTSDVAVISYTNSSSTAATYIVSSGVGDNYIYKIEITAGTLAVNDVKSVKANVFSSGNRIYVSNLDSKKTDVNVYSANGSLVKSIKTNSDSNFELNAKGVYIVNLKSEAGEKSVKVLIK